MENEVGKDGKDGDTLTESSAVSKSSSKAGKFHEEAHADAKIDSTGESQTPAFATCESGSEVKPIHTERNTDEKVYEKSDDKKSGKENRGIPDDYELRKNLCVIINYYLDQLAIKKQKLEQHQKLEKKSKSTSISASESSADKSTFETSKSIKEESNNIKNWGIFLESVEFFKKVICHVHGCLDYNDEKYIDGNQLGPIPPPRIVQVLRGTLSLVICLLFRVDVPHPVEDKNLDNPDELLDDSGNIEHKDNKSSKLNVGSLKNDVDADNISEYVKKEEIRHFNMCSVLNSFFGETIRLCVVGIRYNIPRLNQILLMLLGGEVVFTIPASLISRLNELNNNENESQGKEESPKPSSVNECSNVSVMVTDTSPDVNAKKEEDKSGKVANAEKNSETNVNLKNAESKEKNYESESDTYKSIDDIIIESLDLECNRPSIEKVYMQTRSQLTKLMLPSTGTFDVHINTATLFPSESQMAKFDAAKGGVRNSWYHKHGCPVLRHICNKEEWYWPTPMGMLDIYKKANRLVGLRVRRRRKDKDEKRQIGEPKIEWDIGVLTGYCVKTNRYKFLHLSSYNNMTKNTPEPEKSSNTDGHTVGIREREMEYLEKSEHNLKSAPRLEPNSGNIRVKGASESTARQAVRNLLMSRYRREKDKISKEEIEPSRVQNEGDRTDNEKQHTNSEDGKNLSKSSSESLNESSSNLGVIEWLDLNSEIIQFLKPKSEYKVVKKHLKNNSSDVGLTLRIFWPQDDKWWIGTIMKWSKDKGHVVSYSDGDERTYMDLIDRKFEIVVPKSDDGDNSNRESEGDYSGVDEDFVDSFNKVLAETNIFFARPKHPKFMAASSVESKMEFESPNMSFHDDERSIWSSDDERYSVDVGEELAPSNVMSSSQPPIDKYFNAGLRLEYGDGDVEWDEETFQYVNYEGLLPVKNRGLSWFLLRNIEIFGREGGLQIISDHLKSMNHVNASHVEMKKQKGTEIVTMLLCTVVVVHNYLRVQVLEDFSQRIYDSVCDYMTFLTDENLNTLCLSDMIAMSEITARFNAVSSPQYSSVGVEDGRDIVEKWLESAEKHLAIFLLVFLRSSKLDNRLFGLNSILEIIRKVSGQQSRESSTVKLKSVSGKYNNQGSKRDAKKNQPNTLTWNELLSLNFKKLNNEWIVGWLVKSQVVKHLYSGNRMHIELVRRSSPVVLFFAKQGVICPSDIQILCKACLEKHDALMLVLHRLLISLTPKLNKIQRLYMFDIIKDYLLPSCRRSVREETEPNSTLPSANVLIPLLRLVYELTVSALRADKVKNKEKNPNNIVQQHQILGEDDRSNSLGKASTGELSFNSDVDSEKDKNTNVTAKSSPETVNWYGLYIMWEFLLDSEDEELSTQNADNNMYDAMLRADNGHGGHHLSNQGSNMHIENKVYDETLVATKLLVRLVGSDCVSERQNLLKLCIENIRRCFSVPQSVDVLRRIICTYPRVRRVSSLRERFLSNTKRQRTVIDSLEKKYGLLQMLLQDLSIYHERFSKEFSKVYPNFISCPTLSMKWESAIHINQDSKANQETVASYSNKDIFELVDSFKLRGSCYTHLEQLHFRFDFILFFVSRSNCRLGYNETRDIWNMYVVNAHSPLSRDLVLAWFGKAQTAGPTNNSIITSASTSPISSLTSVSSTPGASTSIKGQTGSMVATTSANTHNSHNIYSSENVKTKVKKSSVLAKTEVNADDALVDSNLSDLEDDDEMTSETLEALNFTAFSEDVMKGIFERQMPTLDCRYMSIIGARVYHSYFIAMNMKYDTLSINLEKIPMMKERDYYQEIYEKNPGKDKVKNRDIDLEGSSKENQNENTASSGSNSGYVTVGGNRRSRKRKRQAVAELNAAMFASFSYPSREKFIVPSINRGSFTDFNNVIERFERSSDMLFGEEHLWKLALYAEEETVGKTTIDMIVRFQLNLGNRFRAKKILGAKLHLGFMNTCVKYMQPFQEPYWKNESKIENDQDQQDGTTRVICRAANALKTFLSAFIVQQASHRSIEIAVLPPACGKPGSLSRRDWVPKTLSTPCRLSAPANITFESLTRRIMKELKFTSNVKGFDYSFRIVNKAENCEEIPKTVGRTFDKIKDGPLLLHELGIGDGTTIKVVDEKVNRSKDKTSDAKMNKKTDEMKRDLNLDPEESSVDEHIKLSFESPRAVELMSLGFHSLYSHKTRETLKTQLLYTKEMQSIYVALLQILDKYESSNLPDEDEDALNTSKDATKLIWDCLDLLPPDMSMFYKIIELDFHEKWESIFPYQNLHILLYNLQMLESILCEPDIGGINISTAINRIFHKDSSGVEQNVQKEQTDRKKENAGKEESSDNTKSKSKPSGIVDSPAETASISSSMGFCLAVDGESSALENWCNLFLARGGLNHLISVLGQHSNLKGEKRATCISVLLKIITVFLEKDERMKSNIDLFMLDRSVQGPVIERDILVNTTELDETKSLCTSEIKMPEKTNDPESSQVDRIGSEEAEALVPSSIAENGQVPDECDLNNSEGNIHNETVDVNKQSSTGGNVKGSNTAARTGGLKRLSLFSITKGRKPPSSLSISGDSHDMGKYPDIVSKDVSCKVVDRAISPVSPLDCKSTLEDNIKALDKNSTSAMKTAGFRNQVDFCSVISSTMDALIETTDCSNEVGLEVVVEIGIRLIISCVALTDQENLIDVMTQNDSSHNTTKVELWFKKLLLLTKNRSSRLETAKGALLLCDRMNKWANVKREKESKVSDIGNGVNLTKLFTYTLAQMLDPFLRGESPIKKEDDVNMAEGMEGSNLALDRRSFHEEYFMLLCGLINLFPKEDSNQTGLGKDDDNENRVDVDLCRLFDCTVETLLMHSSLETFDSEQCDSFMIGLLELARTLLIWNPGLKCRKSIQSIGLADKLYRDFLFPKPQLPTYSDSVTEANTTVSANDDPLKISPKTSDIANAKAISNDQTMKECKVNTENVDGLNVCGDPVKNDNEAPNDFSSEYPLDNSSIELRVGGKCKSRISRYTACAFLAELCSDQILRTRDLLKLLDDDAMYWKSVRENRKREKTTRCLPLVTRSENSNMGPTKSGEDFPAFLANEEEMVLDDYNSTPTHYAGLKNQGTTCYMNAFLQQLHKIPSLRDSILSLGQLNETESSLLTSLQLLFTSLSNGSRTYVDTKNVCCALKEQNGESIDVTEQKDVVEFAGMLFEQMEKESKVARDLLKDHFGGVLVNQIISSDVENPYVSETKEPFLMLPLDIKNKKNLKDALEGFVEGEEMTGENQYKLPTGEMVDAVKRCCIRSLPKHLIINLKRFEFDHTTMKTKKVNDLFQFPQILRIRPTESEQALSSSRQTGSQTVDSDNTDNSSSPEEDVLPEYTYVLNGILVHSGSTESGHYYSFIREREPKDSRIGRQWYEFNDRLVWPYPEDRISIDCFGGANTKHSAFLLFYDQIQGIHNPGLHGQEIMYPLNKFSVVAFSQQQRPYPFTKYDKRVLDKMFVDNLTSAYENNLFTLTTIRFVWNILTVATSLDRMEAQVTKDIYSHALKLSVCFFDCVLIHGGFSYSNHIVSEWGEMMLQLLELSGDNEYVLLTLGKRELLIDTDLAHVRKVVCALCFRCVQNMKVQAKSENPDIKIDICANIRQVTQYANEAKTKNCAEYFHLLYLLSTLNQKATQNVCQDKNNGEVDSLEELSLDSLTTTMLKSAWLDWFVVSRTDLAKTMFAYFSNNSAKRSKEIIEWVLKAISAIYSPSLRTVKSAYVSLLCLLEHLLQLEDTDLEMALINRPKRSEIVVPKLVSQISNVLAGSTSIGIHGKKNMHGFIFNASRMLLSLAAKNSHFRAQLMKKKEIWETFKLK